MKCDNCSNKMVSKIESYHYTESGLDNVYIETDVYRCKKCKEIIADIPAMDELNDIVGIAIVNKNTILTGKEIKFLRKQMLLKANELAAILGVTKQTVSRWENDKEKISKYTDRLIRMAYIQLLQEKCNTVFKEVLEKMKAIKPVAGRKRINIPHDRIKESICDLPSFATM